MIKRLIPAIIRRKIKNYLMNRWHLQPIPYSPNIDARVKSLAWFFSPEDDPGKPNEYLINLCIEVISATKDINLNEIIQRFPKNGIEGIYPNLWPGDHYRLLAGFVKTLHPKLVIEIGTSFGTSALALKKYLPEKSKIITYDISPYHNTKYPLLCENDFADNRLEQIIGDPGDEVFYKLQIEFFKQAELIFIDAKKDNITEQRFINNFKKTEFINNPLMIWDDIKAIPEIWRNFTYPKLDLTSFGHFTGTGILLWEKKII